MKKLIIVFISFLIMGFSFVYAQPSNMLATQGLSIGKNIALSDMDRNLIFNDGANAILLDNDEMMATQGQGWFSNWFLPVAYVGGVLTCAIFSPPCALAFVF